MVQCPSCARPHEPCLVCADCGSPIAAELDCFAALGLPRRLTIDLEDLEQRYHDLGRRLHPDRFAASPKEVREASLKATALLTRSYRTLRDPISRGRYWLELKGEKLAENNKQVPVEIAELVFDVQEQLAEMRAASSNGSGSKAKGLATEVAERRKMLQASLDEAREELARNFSRWDAYGDKERPALTGELKSILSRLAYLRTLVRDVDRELERAGAVA
jgi:molecular chaperone HscB